MLIQSQEEVRSANVLVEDAAPVRPLRAISLRSNMLWTLAGNIVYAGCQWALLVVVAKLTSPEQVGEFALALALSAPVFMLTNLQLRSVQATDSEGEHTFGDYLGLRLITTIAGFCLVLAIALISGYRSHTLAVIAVVTAAKGFEATSDVYFGLLQQHEWMERIARSMIVKGFLSIAALSAALWATHRLVTAYAALACAWLAVLVLYDLRSARKLLGPVLSQPRWSIATMKRIGWFAAPLGVSMMLISLYINIPRYFIERSLGTRELGVFAAMAYIVVAGTTVINALGQAATPRLAKLFAARLYNSFDTLLAKLCGFALLLGGVQVLVAAAFGQRLLTLLYRPEYARRIDVFLLIMIAAGISYCGNFLGYALTATRAFRQSAMVYGAIALVALASAMLIPRWGLRGAGWSMCIVALATCLVPFLVLRRLRAQQA